MIDEQQQEVIDKLRSLSAPMYVAISFENPDTGIVSEQTGCIVYSEPGGSEQQQVVRVVTCCHGVHQQLVVNCYGSRIGRSGETGRVVYVDPRVDMALIELRVAVVISKKPNKQILVFQLNPLIPGFGSSVMVFGFPTTSYQLCSGIVSCPAAISYNMETSYAMMTIPEPPAGYSGGYASVYPAGRADIQHTAPICSGYSGGPLIDGDTGQLIGINHSIGSGIACAYSSSYISDFLKNADTCMDRQFNRRLTEHREIRLGYQIRYILNAYCLVKKIMDTGANAELKPTDLIVKLNGQPIESLDHFVQVLDHCPNNLDIPVQLKSLIPNQSANRPEKIIQLMPTGLTYV
ncbi:uncharacterized protein LOC128956626 [Oppia nitens]|uniref:uncharacterized protein LOC128956626 n=1 Tax=Oppia nitens TaxID=1686743 RepID=UPI0023DC3CBD|nr:uncharacterized protein LOC128956626 [Oppia nitens]